MAKIARTLCENAAQHISIVRNYAWEYIEQCVLPHSSTAITEFPYALQLKEEPK